MSEPKVNQLCWFWDDDDEKCIHRFYEYDHGGLLYYPYKTVTGYEYRFCEPLKASEVIGFLKLAEPDVTFTVIIETDPKIDNLVPAEKILNEIKINDYVKIVRKTETSVKWNESGQMSHLLGEIGLVVDKWDNQATLYFQTCAAQWNIDISCIEKVSRVEARKMIDAQLNKKVETKPKDIKAIQEDNEIGTIIKEIENSKDKNISCIVYDDDLRDYIKIRE